MVSKKKNHDWTIHAGGRGWFAWDGRKRHRVTLVRVGSFSEAVKEFEERIGPWYEEDGDEDRYRQCCPVCGSEGEWRSVDNHDATCGECGVKVDLRLVPVREKD